MEQDEHIIRLHSIISRTMLKVQTNDEIRAIGRSIGVPDVGFVDFIMGLMYCTSQESFRKESGLSVTEADNIFLAFWKKEGRDIRTRLIQKIEENGKYSQSARIKGMLDYPPPERVLELTTEFLDFITNQKNSLLDYQYFVDQLERLHPDDRHKFFHNIAQKFKEKP